MALRYQEEKCLLLHGFYELFDRLEQLRQWIVYFTQVFLAAIEVFQMEFTHKCSVPGCYNDKIKSAIAR